jgi:hypothetical protein
LRRRFRSRRQLGRVGLVDAVADRVAALTERGYKRPRPASFAPYLEKS